MLEQVCIVCYIRCADVGHQEGIQAVKYLALTVTQILFSCGLGVVEILTLRGGLMTKMTESTGYCRFLNKTRLLLKKSATRFL